MTPSCRRCIIAALMVVLKHLRITQMYVSCLGKLLINTTALVDGLETINMCTYFDSAFTNTQEYYMAGPLFLYKYFTKDPHFMVAIARGLPFEVVSGITAAKALSP